MFNTIFGIGPDEVTNPDDDGEEEVTVDLEAQPPKTKLDNKSNVSPKGKDGSELYEDMEGGPLPPSVMKQLTHFRRKQDKGFVDVWWLYDSGGKRIVFKNLNFNVAHILNV